MGLSKDKLIFDETAIADSDQVGAHILGSSSLKVTSTTVGPKEALDVNVLNAGNDGFYLEDDPHASGDIGMFSLAVRRDAETSSVSTDGDYSAFHVNNEGRLKSNLRSEYAEDTPHASGDKGISILSRRRDAYGSSADTQNDYATIDTDEFGRLWTNHAFQDPSGPNYGATSVDNTVGGTLLSVRPNGAVKVIYQNVGNKECFIGRDTSVLTTTGLRLAPGASIELDAAQGVDFYGITASGTTDIRYMDFS